MHKRLMALTMVMMLALGGCRGIGKPPARQPEPVVDLTEQWGKVDQAVRQALSQVGATYKITTEPFTINTYTSSQTQLHAPSRRETATFDAPVATDKIVSQLTQQLQSLSGQLSGIQMTPKDDWQTMQMEIGYNYTQVKPSVYIRTHVLTVNYQDLAKVALPAAPPGTVKGKMALVIDDFGYGGAASQAILALNAPLTIAVLPHISDSISLAQQAKRQGHEVILHMPMEPQDSSKNPGPGAVYVSGGDDEIKAAVSNGLTQVPGASGISNHEGSLATSDTRVMTSVLQVARDHSLFFFDSGTTSSSVVGTVAQRLGVPSVANDRFLDNIRDKEKIKSEIRELAKVSFRAGPVIGIGHVHEAMAEALQEMLPELKQAGIQLIPVSQLARVSGRGTNQ